MVVGLRSPDRIPLDLKSLSEFDRKNASTISHSGGWVMEVGGKGAW